MPPHFTAAAAFISDPLTGVSRTARRSSLRVFAVTARIQASPVTLRALTTPSPPDGVHSRGRLLAERHNAQFVEERHCRPSTKQVSSTPTVAWLQEGSRDADPSGMDLLYDAAEACLAFRQSGPEFPIGFVYIAIAAVPVTLLHELGHAVAARALVGGDVEVSVGSAGKLAEIRLGQIAMSINALSNPARVSGAAYIDDASASARDVVWIALAGPLASLAGLAAASVLYSAAPPTGVAHDLLWATVATSAFGVLNIVPLKFQERRDGPLLRTDGRLAIDALRASRALR